MWVKCGLTGCDYSYIKFHLIQQKYQTVIESNLISPLHIIHLKNPLHFQAFSKIIISDRNDMKILPSQPVMTSLKIQDQIKFKVTPGDSIYCLQNMQQFNMLQRQDF